MTPRTPVWLAGYGGRRVPAGTVHDLWIKTLALEDRRGRRAVLITSDHMGMPPAMYERIRRGVAERCGIEQAQFMLLFSHNHCGPVLRDDLVDYYPLDAEQASRVGAYTDEVTDIAIDTVRAALERLQPVRLATGWGATRFAVNRRDNPEAEVPRRLARGQPLAGAVDHSVPVLAVRAEDEQLLGILFGYACHPTTMNFARWCGDYPGFAQLALEDSHPGAAALFFPGCGADQNPLPRRQLHLCRRYGHMLAAAVEEVLRQPLAEVGGGLEVAFRHVDLEFEGLVSAQSLAAHIASANPVRARWARRWQAILERQPPVVPAARYPYPIQVWQLGNLLLIALGGEAVVDYALHLRRLYGPHTWVSGYAHTLVAYIPSRRVQLEGGYEGADFLFEYGHGAERWGAEVESRILDAVMAMVGQVRGAARTGA